MLDATVWFQVSGKYRIVAKLPNGMTGIKALQSKKIREPEWAERMGEGHAGDYFLRCCSVETQELTHEEWTTFKKTGGTTYISHTWDKHKDKATRVTELMVSLKFVEPKMAHFVHNILIQEYA